MIFDPTADIKEISSEQLAEMYDEMRTTVKEIEEGQSVVLDELGDRIRALKLNGTKFGKWLVTLPNPRISVSEVYLSTAKELGATKEVVDASKIYSLYQRGIKIEGVKFSISRPLITNSEKPRKVGEK